MTQPNEAVGGANDEPIIAAEPTLEDRFAAFSEQEEGHPEAVTEQPEGEPELTEEDVAELEADEGQEADQKPIQPPVSWTAEEKEEFGKLPRALQETLTRREAEREKFVQTKAQEAAQVRTQAETQANERFQQVLGTHVAALQQLLVQVPQEPGINLKYENEYEYDQLMEAHKNAAAHNRWVEQRITGARQQVQQAEQQAQALAAQEFQSVLSDKLPAFFDAQEGPKLRSELASIASDLGYSAEQINSADANDVLAMHRVSQLKAKADKYDTLMAKKMEKVREAKQMPRVSRPGTAQGPGVAANQKYTADRQAMRQGDRDAAARVFGKFL